MKPAPAPSAVRRAHLSPAAYRAAREGDAASRRRLAERYLPLAKGLAARFRTRGEPMDDLVQVASLGLLKAIDRFDPDRGLAFSSFAVPTILGELRRHFRDHTWSVHMPRALQESSARLTKVDAELATRLGRRPTVAELCLETGKTQEAVLEALEAGRAYRSSSLDKPLGDDADEPLGVTLGAVDSGYDEVDIRETLERATSVLTERQRSVLWMHVDQDLTQDEISRRVGISQMQVSRDLAVARGRLRPGLFPA